MPRLTILPDPGVLRLDGLARGDTDEIVLTVSAAAGDACGAASGCVLSRHIRRVADLPSRGVPVRLRASACGGSSAMSASAPSASLLCGCRQ